MPVLQPWLRARYRKQYRRLIHNADFTVRRCVTITQSNIPGYDKQTTRTYKEYTGFKASMYDILSGKLSRIFTAKVEFASLPAGLLDQTGYLVQYAIGYHDLVVGTVTASENATGGFVTTDDLSALGIIDGAVIIVNNEQYDITSFSYDEIGADWTIIVSGLDSLAGETGEIRNKTELQTGDQVSLEGKWRDVLKVVPDSEGIQETALVAA